MKTLILNGSPRKDGDTAFQINKLISRLYGEYKIVDCYAADIAPCIDCRCCHEKLSCPMKDEMQEIYAYLLECDHVIIASPVHYAELSSGLLKVASRFQIYSSAQIFRHEMLPVKAKRAAVILAQGGSGGAERAYETARLIFQSIGVKEVYPLVCSGNTDRLPAADDEKAIGNVLKLAEWLNTFEDEQKNHRDTLQVTWRSTPQEKIALYRSLFHGREDVYALAMPISWSGTLSQYVGRLHREYEGKNSVMIYDYADIHVRMLENMYKKRLRGYAKLGYAPAAVHQDGFQTIYTVHYENDLFRDIAAAKKTVIAAGAYFISGKLSMLNHTADQCKMNGAKAVIITKKADNTYAEKIRQMLAAHDIEHHIKNRIPSSFVVIDRKTVWYASGELFGNIGDDCVLRIEDEVLAGELTESTHEFRVQ